MRGERSFSKRRKRPLRGHKNALLRWIKSKQLVGALIGGLLCAALSEAAVGPNGQDGTCGPYYLWYQVSAENYPPHTEYVDLCGITFDIGEVVDDFDFVYFIDTPGLQRAALDLDRDGVSDLYFAGRNKNQLEWRPPDGCVRINLRECESPSFQRNCGYAMMSIQPKPDFRTGSARIPIGVNLKCPPNGMDCSRAYVIQHAYANCFTAPTPDFMIQQTVDTVLAQGSSYGEEKFQFKITIQNTGTTANSTVMTDTISEGTKGGDLMLIALDMQCPPEALCNLLHADARQLKISLSDIPALKTVEILYKMSPRKKSIPKEVFSYFTNTATLSSGGSSRITVGVKGTGDPDSSSPEPREERPIQETSQRPSDRQSESQAENANTK